MQPLPITEQVARHRKGNEERREAVTLAYERLAAVSDPAIFISLRARDDVIAEVDALSEANGPLPLLGIPVAVKDNIDVAGLPTTAACPTYSYEPHSDATAVAQLRRAGAVVIGKTNLDQFATGLVGVRSPYGVPRNAMRADLVPGGSSSGSAVAVAQGIVPLALGTDTAGSGRVPAGLNNICGLKPSLGLVSTAGVVPACRSLDCVSIFSLTAEDAMLALRIMAGPDPGDAYSRRMEIGAFHEPAPMRLGVPKTVQLEFFGDAEAESTYAAALQIATRVGCELVEIDLAPFLDTARLLYEGAWVAERTAAVGDFIAKHGADVHPVTRTIIEGGSKLSAVDAFRSTYRLRELAALAAPILTGVDAIMVPTAPAAYTVAELEADPIRLNSRLGTYTNFVNLLDMCGFAVPARIAANGTPYGVTFLAAAGRDAELARLAGAFHAATRLPLGAVGGRAPTLPPRTSVQPGEIALAVVGAHLLGMPLNRELTELGARLMEATTTAPDYRLFMLAGTKPPKPGMLRVERDGAAIEVETWALSPQAFGRFVAAVPSPLSIGTVRLSDGQSVKGFLVEPVAVEGARDITAFGGWRKAIAALN